MQPTGQHRTYTERERYGLDALKALSTGGMDGGQARRSSSGATQLSINIFTDVTSKTRTARLRASSSILAVPGQLTHGVGRSSSGGAGERLFGFSLGIHFIMIMCAMDR